MIDQDTLNYPLTFESIYKDHLWGGSTIKKRYQRTTAPTPCAESWEIAAHQDGNSIVANGPLQGHSLIDLTTRFGHALLGTRASDPTRFPLLFKIIDAHADLSLQVHPNEANAAKLQGEPKTEAWVTLDHTPNASIAAGLLPTANQQSLQQSMLDGTAEALLCHHQVARYDTILIPGGLVHSIGAGCLIYEVQQNSNTTYRLFDWNRKDPTGNPRELHIDKGLAAIDWSLPPPTLLHHKPGSAATGVTLLASTPFFNLNRITINSDWRQTLDGTTLHVLFVEHGKVALSSQQTTVVLSEGTSALIPAATPCYTITPTGTSASLLLTTL